MHRVSIIGFLLWALAHSWVGHDVLHGHHHDELDETSWSVYVKHDSSSFMPHYESTPVHACGPGDVSASFPEFRYTQFAVECRELSRLDEPAAQPRAPPRSAPA